ncbi:hypothetical protein D8674_011590 [Pyrus ussuriensis x Pyrus communis]|uniref:Uncharacterized protein n=1 Tax=Pyrus ussuriensis x Pyrus communis TaxID=2448454 RepID=A0A5N5G4S2_9ROSA|nr:hypothetical protein D8674_011590 [Pyrus ussuriensis x Pyrus communis]
MVVQFSAGLETELVFQKYWTIAPLDFPEIWIYHGRETDAALMKKVLLFNLWMLVF